MQARTGYSTLQIGLHWLVAALVLFQLVFGESMTTVVDATADGHPAPAFDQLMASAHFWIGISILALVLLRLTVRLVQGAPAAPTDNTLMALAARATHWLFYALLFAVPVTGLLALYVNDAFGDIHALGKPVFITFIALHATAALFHQFVLKDGTLRRMLASN